MILKGIIEDIKKKWKIYLVIYVICYLIQPITEGVANWKSLFPIKIMPICICMVLGNIFYYARNGINVLDSFRVASKYGIISVLLLISVLMFGLLIKFCFGMDINMYIT